MRDVVASFIPHLYDVRQPEKLPYEERMI